MKKEQWEIENMSRDFLNEAQSISETLESHADHLWNCAEVGFELPKTLGYVKKRLKDIGVYMEECGKCGLCAVIKGKSRGRVVLLRADMDALNLIDSEGKSRTVHACGHHFHTAMLLGAAEIFANNTDFFGEIRIIFQSAEESLMGAKDMIENGILDAPRPDAAMMIHVMTGVDMPVGTVVVSEGISAPAADFFNIDIYGKGAHGALSHQGVDALSVGAYTLVALHEIKSREVSIGDRAGITVGKIRGGEAANVLPESVNLSGSIRAFDEDVRALIKKRVCEVCEGIANTFRAKAKVEFTSGCPALKNDDGISQICYEALKSIFKDGTVWRSSDFDENMVGGSEDFSYIAAEIPSVAIGLCAGSINDGYRLPLHNPSVAFDKRALPYGVAAFSAFAMSFLREKE
jgi:hippurate hydrolase